MGKIFRNRDFRFKIRFGPFWIDSDQKKFSTKNFCLCHFFDQKWPKIEVFWKFWAKKSFFQKKFFRLEISEKPLSLTILAKNSINLVSLQSLKDVRMRVIAQNDRNTILLKLVKKNLKFLHPKIKKKSIFWAQKMAKNDQKIENFSKIFRKFFFGRNRFRMVQNVF